MLELESEIKIAPSILSADWGYLGSEVQRVRRGGANIIHYDVMDGQFVPMITVGSAVLKRLKELSNLPFDTHLMVKTPERHIKSFCEAGTDYLTIHAEEVNGNLDKIIEEMDSFGVVKGIAFDLGTDPSHPSYNEICRYIMDGKFDMVLVMGVKAGAGGQSFNEESLKTISYIRGLNPNIPIEFDGGINYLPEIDGRSTADLVAERGARIIVAGSKVFNPEFISDDYKTPIQRIREQALIGYMASQKK